MTRPSGTTTVLERRCRHCGAAASADLAFCSHCGARLALPDIANDPMLSALTSMFAGELEIECEIGRGANGAVYLATDLVLRRRVAIKVLLPEVAADAEMASRFIREARFVAALQHPHVVAVHGVRTSGSVSAIVMQYVDGNSLDVVLSRHAPLDMQAGGLILSQVAAGLQHAHDRGIVHRDVKPANVLIANDGTAVVSDFGLAVQEGATRVTATGLVVGTLAYMSPEQRTGEESTPLSDQYALGVMAFEVLAGRRPFVGTFSEVHDAHLSAPPPPIGSLRPGLPEEIETVIGLMLAKTPSQRLPDLRDAERAFRRLVPDRQATTAVVASLSGQRNVQRARTTTVEVRAAAPIPPTAEAPPVQRVATTEIARPVPVQRSHPLRWALGGGLVAAAGLAVLLTVAGRSADDATLVAGKNGALDTGAVIAPPPRNPVSADNSGRPPTGKAATAPSPETKVDSSAASGATTIAAAQSSDSGATTVAGTGMQTRDTAPPPRARVEAAVVSERPVEPPPIPAARSFPLPVIGDARAIARAFVTMINSRRWQEVNALGVIRGDTTLRAELVRLTRNAPEFAAGFERVASTPQATADGFITECILDLAWRGGRRAMLAELHAVYRDDGWHLVAFRLETFSPQP